VGNEREIALRIGLALDSIGQISDVVAAIHEDAFARVQIFNYEHLGHAPPPSDAFDRALTWLEGRL